MYEKYYQELVKEIGLAHKMNDRVHRHTVMRQWVEAAEDFYFFHIEEMDERRMKDFIRDVILVLSLYRTRYQMGDYYQVSVLHMLCREPWINCWLELIAEGFNVSSSFIGTHPVVRSSLALMK